MPKKWTKKPSWLYHFKQLSFLCCYISWWIIRTILTKLLNLPISNNLCRKLVSSLESPIIVDENLELLQLHSSVTSVFLQFNFYNGIIPKENRFKVLLRFLVNIFPARTIFLVKLICCVAFWISIKSNHFKINPYFFERII